MKLCFFLIMLILLPILAQAQGGGGGGSGGGGDSNYYDTCVVDCKSDAGCIQNCKKTSTTVTAVIVSVVGAIFLFVGGCLLYKKNKLPKFMCKCCCCHQYNRLKKRLNVVDPGNMTPQHYKSEVQRIINYFNATSKGQYTFQQNRQTYVVQAKVRIASERNYLTEIILVGSDHFGQWDGKGYIVCRDGGEMFVWFYKQYRDRARAGQTDKWEHLVIESSKILDFGIEGVWYYVGFEYSNEYSGKWAIHAQQFDNQYYAKNS